MTDLRMTADFVFAQRFPADEQSSLTSVRRSRAIKPSQSDMTNQMAHPIGKRQFERLDQFLQSRPMGGQAKMFRWCRCH